jgi:NADPH:quinone reductase
MHAAWYQRCGPANEVLTVGEMEAPRPGPGEVLVRLRASGINPGDAKKRADWMGFGIGYARVIPHSDGAGTIEEVGTGVPPPASASGCGYGLLSLGGPSAQPPSTSRCRANKR